MCRLKTLFFFTVVSCILLCRKDAVAQAAAEGQGMHVRAVIVGTDTLPSITLNIFEVTEKLPRRLRKERERWSRLRNAVYVTYPYARSASRILKDVNARLASMPNKKDRKAYLATKEKELKAEFGDKLENLSIYQGKVLMKLINRETGENCYEIIKELKGGFNARVWQTVAFFFGGNLKSEYDKEEDSDIEVIVQEIEMYRYYRAYN
ncbi:DUF4294 domain-containing protein [Chitinophaga agrisoli]|uniref:DUF4294 domain-containing protein n=1 Tax=Chitinophaga agrisoli TaxID=2607653 RepID=A0A5B2VXM0_9BACT|nr:DUF4294 domain-containing protein [Chitinophaga agrisoli]KAA2243062.1 DUF4294 domain-containing protein [Chitinophaga agrisoli]